jgi:ABC-2 type transport system ATP-binding protein
MGQRLGIATALLGDPPTVVLDEPVNGLDPEGIRWVRDLLKGLAAEGRTVFVSSHLMSEMALTAEHVIVVGRGRLIADTSVEEIIRGASANTVLVRSPDAAQLRSALVGADVTVSSTEADVLRVTGLNAAQIGEAARGLGVALHELTPQMASLEEAFMTMTADDVEYHGHLATEATVLEGQGA